MGTFEFRSEARELPYFSDPGHALLTFDDWILPGANKSDRPYDNLTLAMLPSDSAEHILRLIKSLSVNIPKFFGEVLFPANTVHILSAELLSHKMKDWGVTDWRCLEEGDVLGYKNLVIGSASREWVLLLDPSVSLQWNPLLVVEKEIATHGVQVINLPRVTREGRYVSIDHLGFERRQRQFCIVGRSIARASGEVQGRGAALCTGLDSASLMIRLDLLKELGGFDETQGENTTDIGLAVKLFRRGIKVLVSEAVAIFDDELASSGERVLVMGSTEAEIKIPEIVEDEPALEKMGGTRPKIALIVDVYYWAFGNISRQLKRYLSDRYEFKIIPIGDVGSLLRVLMLAEDCELIHFFWREELLQIGSHHYRIAAEKLGMSWDAFEQRFLRGKLITTSIYDHLMKDSTSLESRAKCYTEIHGYTVANKKLLKFYGNPPVAFPPPTCTTQDGVDLTLFRPIGIERLESAASRELIVGWVGNSAWEGRTEDFKGLHTVLRPAVMELQAEGYPIRLELADRQLGFTPHEAMPGYYSKIDVLACSSKIEGTPNPVLEAMACGVPVVATDVGIVPEVFGLLQRRYILEERSKDCMKSKLKGLIAQRDELLALSKENLESIRSWDWSIKAENFHRFFNSVLLGKRQP